MEAIILAAGYATRLYPLTENRAKPLLPVGDKALIDHTMKHLEEVPNVDRIHVVSNDRFYAPFLRWQEDRPERDRINVYNDGTFENADRLGAIGDAEYVIRKAEIGDELLIVAGDNLFDFNLGEFYRFFKEKGSSCCAVYEFPDREMIKQYSVVETDSDQKVTFFEEKPKDPQTDLIAICCYLFTPEHVPLVREYLSDGQNPDAPGYFIQWLHKQVDVYAYPFSGLWFDIGNIDQLTEADNIMRERAGMSVREKYELDA